MTSNEPNILMGDSPQSSIEGDQFGFLKFSSAIANAIRSRVSTNGYALGIEGPWGSGKTTLLNFVEEDLLRGAQSHRKIIRFEPWLISDRVALLRTFLSRLAAAIEEFRTDAVLDLKLGKGRDELLARLIQNLRSYSQLIEIGGSVTTVVMAWIPGGWLAAPLLKAAQWLVLRQLKRNPPSIESLKELIVGDLRVLSNLVPGAAVVVLIDDTDRLDAEESVELLRLIKAVANFPLVTYLVCFDRKILSTRIQRAMGVGDGEDYLEKIFQQIVPVPPQEPFALRRFIRRNLARHFPDEERKASVDPDLAERSAAVFDTWVGELIRTPRDATRYCDNILFGWPHIKDRADFIDYCWLQLIKLRHPGLYEWVGDYLVAMGSYRDGGRPGEIERAALAAKLRDHLQKLGWGTAPDRSGITSILPGLRPLLWSGNQSSVFEFDPEDELKRYEAECRLGSPSHWRYYFAFEKPSYAIGDDELFEFIELVGNEPDSGARHLREIQARAGNMAVAHLDMFFERLDGRKRLFAVGQQINLAAVLSEVMDDVPRGTLHGFGGSDPWRKAARLLGRGASPRISAVFETAPAINWIAFVLRDQGFALGIVGRTPSPERQWVEINDFYYAIAVALKRFRSMGLSRLLTKPFPIEILFCLLQLGPPNELKAIIEKLTAVDDALFVRLLFALRSDVSSSDKGLYSALHASVVNMFMDGPSTRLRLTKIANTATGPAKLAAQLDSEWENMN